MKRIVSFIILSLLLFVCGQKLEAPVVSARAEENETAVKLEEYTEEQLNALDLDAFQKFADSISAEYLDNVTLSDYLRRVINGEEALSFSMVCARLAKAVSLELHILLPTLISIVILCLVQSLLLGLNGSLAAKGTNKLIETVCLSAIMLLLLGTVYSSVKSVTEYVGLVDGLMEVSFPLLLVVMTAIGSVTTAALLTPLFSILLLLIEQMAYSVVLPCFLAIIVFIFVGRLSDSIKLEKLTKFLKSTSQWLLCSVFGIFGAFVTLRGIRGSTLDSVTVKATKYALSGYVPLVGGYLSDGLDLVTLSLVMIKNSLGVTVNVILLLLTIVPIAKLTVVILSLKLVSAVVEPIGAGALADVIYKLAEALTLLLVIVVAVAFVAFIFILLIMVCAGSV